MEILGTTSSSLWTYKLDVYNINSPNINDNTSTMRVDVYLGRASTAGNSYVGGNWSGHVSIDWQTPTQYTVPISGTIPFPTTINAGTWYWLKTVDFTIKHNNDGTKKQRVTSEITQTEFTPSYCAADGYVTLVTIPRATDLPTPGTAYIEDRLSLQLSPKISNPKHSLKVAFGNLSQWLQSDGTLGKSETKLSTNSLSVLIPKEYYTQFDGATGVGTMYLYTYNGDTKIGTSQKSFKAACSSALCTPQLDATIVDINNVTVNLTGNNNVLVANASNALITPTIQISDLDDTTAKITSKSVDDTVFTEETVVIPEITKKDFLLSVTNSRLLTGRQTISATGELIPYTKLTFNIDSLYRPESTGSEIILKYSGRFYSGDFAEGVPNELTIWWKYKTGIDDYIDGGVLTPTIDTENYTYSGEVVLGDIFDYQNQYDFQFFYKDKIIGINNDKVATGTVPRGIPVYWWTKNEFHIEGDLYTKDTLVTGEVPLEQYSRTELVTNKRWINGKPIYRAVIPVDFSTAHTSKETVHGLVNIEFIVSQKLIWYDTNDKAWFENNKDVGTSDYMIGIDFVSNTVIKIKQNAYDWQNRTRDRYCVIEYTKTTDDAATVVNLEEE